jgi:hypothetical protein
VLAGVVVGWTAAVLVTRLGRPRIVRLASLGSRVSDPLLKLVPDRLPGARPAGCAT